MKTGKIEISLWNKTIQSLLIAETIETLRLAMALLSEEGMFVFWAWASTHGSVNKLELPIPKYYVGRYFGKESWTVDNIKSGMHVKYFDGSGDKGPFKTLMRIKQKYDDRHME